MRLRFRKRGDCDRVELLELDSGMAAICRELFGDTVLKYTKPVTRLTGHLAGFDPSTAPSFVWPERLRAAKDEIRRAAERRARAAELDAPGSSSESVPQ